MILADVQKLEVGNIITVYELDSSAIGGDVDRFHAHNDGPITWQGETYYPWPIKATGFARTGDGQQPQPTLTVSNFGVDELGNEANGLITAMCLALDDLRGAKFTRKRTMAKYLDSANFDVPNPSADPTEHFPDEVWLVEQKSKEDATQVTFKLTSPLTFNDQQIPSRQIIPNLCGWLMKDPPNGGYRGAWCGYTGSNMFDEDGNPVVDPAMDKCGGRLSDCKKRFGENNELRYGGFPNADRLR